MSQNSRPEKNHKHSQFLVTIQLLGYPILTHTQIWLGNSIRSSNWLKGLGNICREYGYPKRSLLLSLPPPLDRKMRTSMMDPKLGLGANLPQKKRNMKKKHIFGGSQLPLYPVDLPINQPAERKGASENVVTLLREELSSGSWSLF